MNHDRLEILLIEDSAADARLLRELLAEARTLPPPVWTHALRLSEGLDLLAQRSFDLVILDLSLPDAHGLDAMVRTHAQAPSVPIVVLTGLDDEVTAARALREGAQDYVVKGRFDGELLSRAIRYAVQRKHAEDDARRLAGEQAARAEAEGMAKRSRLLAEASRALASSLEYEKTLPSVAMYTVPFFADHCIVDVVEGNAIRRVAAAHAEGAEPDLAESRESIPPPLPDAGSCDVIRVPLVAGERVHGEITFVASPGRKYGQDDAAFAVELAGIAALAIDNAGLFHEAQRAIRAREDMLAIVSHDLRNPLSVITLSCSSITDTMPEGPLSKSDERLRATANRIVRAAERMEALIRDLLDAASIEAARLTVEPTPHLAEAVVTEAVEMVAILMAAKSLRLVKSVTCPGAVVVCDLPRVCQVFSNLLGNAIKHTPDGGTITVSAREAYGRIEFAVADTGPGIPESQRPKLFDRYWQAQRTTRAGVGLGLYIAQGIVRAHGGEIQVESKVGEGSRFAFWLPRVDAEHCVPPHVQAR